MTTSTRILAILAAGLCACSESARHEQPEQKLATSRRHQPICKGHGHHCQAHLLVDAHGRPVFHATQQGYGPSDFASAYKFDPTRDPGATIAVVDAYGYSQLESDLAAYRSNYGLQACTSASGCLKIVNQQGKTSPMPAEAQADCQYGDWTEETALDVQMASAACPKCKLLVVLVDDDQDLTNLFEGVNTAASLGATVISNSWGAPEPMVSSDSNGNSVATLEAYMNHPGIAIFVASGDDGYDDEMGQYQKTGVDFPGSARYVTAVGGTTLNTASNTRGWTETAWNSGQGNGAGGSGCSTMVPKPTWQTASTCSGKATADVSAVADMQIAIYNNGPSAQQCGGGGWTEIGGTSAASPLVAGIYALTGNGAQDPSWAYAHTSAFFDVTSGNNGSCGTILCTAKVGWDGPTGVGTPNGALMVATQGSPNGATCSANPDCQSAHCVSGVCCNTACNAQCQACSTGTCSPTTGGSCDDGNPCTDGDTCSNGSCAGTAKSCGAAPDACHLAPTCDKTSGSCTAAIAKNGTACSDGNPCTQSDVCQNGVCTGTAVTCPAPDSCHQAGICDPTSGACPTSYAAQPDGTACSDGNLCTQNDTCQGGVCQGTPVTTCAADACHEAGTCDPSTGKCNGTPKPDGTSCDDGNLCTSGDVCSNGVCAGAAVTCPAPDACHRAGTCDPSTGACPAAYLAAPDGTQCDDGNACTAGDVCKGGVCQGTPVTCGGDACHQAGSCDPSTGACSASAKPDGTSCDDGDACTTQDQCTGGSCAGSPVDCPAPDACHTAGLCSSATGGCPATYPAAPDGTACDDGDPTTLNDKCTGGVCLGTPGGQCTGRADGTSCDDGNACTTSDHCVAGACTGTAKVCPAPAACHAPGQCNWQTGSCEYVTIANGTPCDDGDPTTSNDTCTSGYCIGTPVAQGACAGQADGSSCDDGNACTLNDHCASGTCVGSAKVCPAPAACHEEGQCDWQTGNCAYRVSANGTACDDGDPTTTGDQCLNGSCVGTKAALGECTGKADGTSCSTGTCSSGSCVAASSPPSQPSGSFGCSSAGAGSASPLWGAMLLLAALLRRRRAG